MKNLKKLFGAMAIGTFIFGFNLNANAETSCNGGEEALFNGTTCESTLESAIDAAEASGGAIKLLKAVDLDSEAEINTANTITIDLNGFTIEGKSDRTFKIIKGNVTFTGTGTILNKTNTSTRGNIYVFGATTDTPSNTTVTIDSNVTVEGINPIVVSTTDNQNSYGLKLDIKGKLLNNIASSAANAALTIHGNVKNTTNAPIINIDDNAKLESTINNHDSAAIYQAGYAITTIGKANISGDTGIIAKAGKLNLNNPTVKGTGEAANPTPSGNGFNGTGAAIQIESNKDYAGAIELVITDGNYTSAKNYTILEYVDNTDDSPATKINKIEIKDGEFEAPTGKDTVELSDEFNTTYANHDKFITGGKFSSDISNFVDESAYGQSESGEVGKLHAIIVVKGKNGEIEVNKNAVFGEQVTIKTTPDAGYKLEKITVVEITGTQPITNIDDLATIPVNNNQFTMPDSNVQVTATFVPEEAETVKITLVVKDDIRENYSVIKGSTLESLLNTLKNEGLNIVGFTDKDGKSLDLNTEVVEGMYIVAVLEDENASEAPKTFDSLINFVGLGVVGLGALGFATKKYLH